MRSHALNSQTTDSAHVARQRASVSEIADPRHTPVRQATEDVNASGANFAALKAREKQAVHDSIYCRLTN